MDFKYRLSEPRLFVPLGSDKVSSLFDAVFVRAQNRDALLLLVERDTDRPHKFHQSILNPQHIHTLPKRLLHPYPPEQKFLFLTFPILG